MKVGGPVRALVTVAVGAGLVYGATNADAQVFWTRPGDVQQVSTASSAARSQVVCPGPDRPGSTGTETDTQRVDILTALAPKSVLSAASGGAGSGKVTATRLPATSGGAPKTVTARGRQLVDSVTGGGAVQVTGVGSDARGLLAMQTATESTRTGRGSSLLECTEPGSDVWLAGGGAQPGRLARLVLTNPGDGAINVDAEVLGHSGVSKSKSAQDVVVPARGRTVVVLGALGRAAADPMIHVTATGGVVQASLLDTWMTGETRGGEELTGPTSAPATSQVLPAVTAAGAPPQVRVAVPGTSEGIVRVRATNTAGAVVTDQVATVAAGSTGVVTLQGLPEGTYSVQVTADEPVVAAAISRTATSGTSDLAWMPAAAPITSLTGFALSTQSPGSNAVLMLASPGRPATARVTMVSPAGVPTTKTVTVPADRPVALTVTSAASGWVSVTKGALYAGLVDHGKDSSGPLLSSTALHPVQVRSDVLDARPATP
ncbi:DUF5719 family protein [Leekyejoonella antrihumi]|uniref:Carboxypeptidase regulatory-like domain-containing protein n=1 Tax=Leekyejoonella antrihumi TaxID=1660198 RepID=A0A563DXV6_9MICO|nr:DUF5719 family protein [Leekyejoonella antrihumi]TWP35090.1 hypothetical protein FGL98_15155 [Leekyejoonella antrihumi]